MNFSIATNISEHIFEEHLILLNHTTNQLLVLNPSARLVWQWISKGYDNTQVIIKLADFFKIPIKVAKRDVKRLCNNWRKHKLLLNKDKTPSIPKKPNNPVIYTDFDTQLFNTKKCYLLANIPFSLCFSV